MLNQKMNPLKRLSIKNLHKRYGSIQALKTFLSTFIKAMFTEFQPNGSGKSTTLGIVLNVVNKTSGEYNWFNGTIETHEALKKVGAIIERPNFIRT
jgi:ABC-2 type transport system ATP-binding protein